MSNECGNSIDKKDFVAEFICNLDDLIKRRKNIFSGKAVWRLGEHSTRTARLLRLFRWSLF
jgi:hypothetical protein